MLNVQIIPASAAPAALTESNRQKNEDWDFLAEQVQDIKRGDWVRIAFEDMPGKSTSSKRLNLTKALATRKVFVVSRILGAHLYIRCRRPGPEAQGTGGKVVQLPRCSRNSQITATSLTASCAHLYKA